MHAIHVYISLMILKMWELMLRVSLIDAVVALFIYNIVPWYRMSGGPVCDSRFLPLRACFLQQFASVYLVSLRYYFFHNFISIMAYNYKIRNKILWIICWQHRFLCKEVLVLNSILNKKCLSHNISRFRQLVLGIFPRIFRYGLSIMYYDSISIFIQIGVILIWFLMLFYIFVR